MLEKIITSEFMKKIITPDFIKSVIPKDLSEKLDPVICDIKSFNERFCKIEQNIEKIIEKIEKMEAKDNGIR